MDADWSVELGHNDPTLEFPWSAPDGSRYYIDLLRSPESLTEIYEATKYPELAECLLTLNAPASAWQTVKCDVWIDNELGEAEQIYDATLKFASYIDLIARDAEARISFVRHEHFVKSAVHQISDDDSQPSSCELIIRRCLYQTEEVSSDLTSGFCVTFYVFGYGNDEAGANALWARGLRRATSILLAFTP